jgi:hypothetical protein
MFRNNNINYINIYTKTGGIFDTYAASSIVSGIGIVHELSLTPRTNNENT